MHRLEPWCRRPRVLLIDSDETLLSEAASGLREAEFQVDTAGDIEAAVLTAVDLPPDLIICDVEVGGVPGSALMATIRRLFPGLGVPVIYGSRYQLAEIVCRATPLGFAYHLRKPLDAQIIWDLWQNLSQAAVSSVLNNGVGTAQVEPISPIGAGTARIDTKPMGATVRHRQDAYATGVIQSASRRLVESL